MSHHDHDHDHSFQKPKEGDDVYPILRRAMRWSLGVSLLMLLGKVGAYLLTGSTAILSDAMESIVHIVATALAAWSTWFVSLPASQKSPYGNGKVAYFSAGFEGALILVASVSIFYKAVEALLYGAELKQLSTGLLMIFFLGVVNLFLGLFLIRTGKEHNSLILRANGEHVLTDMWTSAAVVLGVLLVWLTGISWLDPVFAILAALQIMFSAFSLLKRSFQGLMEQTDEATNKRIFSFFDQAKKKGLISDFHQLRFRVVQDVIWLEVHLLMSGSLELIDAHDLVSGLERDLCSEFSKHTLQITSHLEPDRHEDAHPEGHTGLEDPTPKK